MKRVMEREREREMEQTMEINTKNGCSLKGNRLIGQQYLVK
jgi:hypothetical protein